MVASAASVSGVRYPIQCGPYAAEIVQGGATLRFLRHDGRDLVLPFGTDELRPHMRGAVLQPWPNRIPDGRYAFDGTEHQLAVNQPGEPSAIHGLVSWLAYDVVDRADDHVALAATLLPQPGYPFALHSEINYRLGEDGLTIELAATNVGNGVAPYGAGLHPYLVPGPGRVDDWTLTLAAETMTVAEPPRYLSGPQRSVAGSDADFAAGRQLGDRVLCHTYHGLGRDADGWAAARVTGADGAGVQLCWDRAAEWAMVFSYDLDTTAARSGLAIEPMTCPTNAFNTGEGLVHLDPGARHAFTTTLSALS